MADPAEMVAMLREVEWSATVCPSLMADGNDLMGCPICLRTQIEGHRPECRLAALLAEADRG